VKIIYYEKIVEKQKSYRMIHTQNTLFNFKLLELKLLIFI
jgi:hypothetical protein